VIAHRGASGLTGEDNTLRSFARAVELGCDYVEFDVRRTRDALACFHDGRVGERAVSSFSLAELREAAGVAVPTLAEVVAFCHGRIGMDVEIKDEGIEGAVVEQLRTAREAGPLLVKSFSTTVVRRVAELEPGYPVGLLAAPAAAGAPPGPALRTAVATTREAGAEFVSPHHGLLADEETARAVLGEMATYPWTVNDREEMVRLAAMPIRGLITDRPDVLLEVLGRGSAT